jgi:hypothetical protein
MFYELKRKWIFVAIVVGVLTIALIAAWIGRSQGEICSSCWNSSWGDINVEIARLETNAAAGDYNAAYELSGLYSIYLDDEEKSKFWLDKAAALGSPLAKQRVNANKSN